MVNSWSLLFDEMNMSNQDYWYEDGFSLTGNPTASGDTINFGGGLPGGMGDDHIVFSSILTKLLVLLNQFPWIILLLVEKILFPLT